MRGWRRFRYETGYTRQCVRELAETADQSYRPFDARASESRGWRHIDNPKYALKRFQKRLAKWMSGEMEVHPALHGGIRRRSTQTAMRPHVGQACVVTLDISRYFPSVTNRAVYALFDRVMRCTPDLCRDLARLTTRGGHLPHGAPTSLVLANLINQPMFFALADHVAGHQCRLTIYVDDVIISGARARECVGGAIGILNSFGYQVAREKIHVMPRDAEQTALGLRVNDDIGISTAKKRQVSLNIASMLSSGFITTGDLAYCKNYCAYLEGVDPTYLAELRTRLAGLQAALPVRDGHSRSKPPIETKPCRHPLECRVLPRGDSSDKKNQPAMAAGRGCVTRDPSVEPGGRPAHGGARLS